MFLDTEGRNFIFILLYFGKIVYTHVACVGSLVTFKVTKISFLPPPRGCVERWEGTLTVIIGHI